MSLAIRVMLVVDCLLGAGAPLLGAQPQQEVSDPQQRVCDQLLARAQQDERLWLRQRIHEPSDTRYVEGYYRVYENRKAGRGREIKIALVVLPARRVERKPDPVFILQGGPGAAALKLFYRNVTSWMREERDIVLIDQRGTGSSNPLHVRQTGTDDHLQSYFDSMFRLSIYQAALPRLKQRADLTQYTTWNAVDDFDDIRAALGYEQVNLRGGSYGSRAALVYMRRHSTSIRSATLQAIQPISYRNPLPHAAESHAVLIKIFAEVQADPAYRSAFGDLEAKFNETLSRLERTPARVVVTHPQDGQDVEIMLNRQAFAECVRVLMYRLDTNRRLPLLLLAAHRGEYRELAEAGLRNSRGTRPMIAFGTLMSVTASEDLSRIAPTEISEHCDGTFLGDVRIRNQLAVAEIWPTGEMPAGFEKPVSVETPTLLFSGSHDPSTSARWGRDAARHLPNSLHVVVPGAHGVSGPAVVELEQLFLKEGDVRNLDLSRIEQLRLPPLIMPAGS